MKAWAITISTAGNTGGQYRQTDVDIEATSDVGGGYSLGYVSGGEWLAYRVLATATADYTLDARVASAGPGGTFHVEVDGIDATGPMVVPNTGGWQTWQTISRAGIPLTAGPHMLRVVIDSQGTDRLSRQLQLSAVDDSGHQCRRRRCS